jgi:glycerol-3-phosphate acyltransferase PlsX
MGDPRAYDAAKNDVLPHISTLIAELMPRNTETRKYPAQLLVDGRTA